MKNIAQGNRIQESPQVRPSTPPNQVNDDNDAAPKTPQTIRSFQRLENKVRNMLSHLERRELDMLNKYFRGARLVAQKNARLQKEIADARKEQAQENRLAQGPGDRRQIQKGGTLSAEPLRNTVRKRHQDEGAKRMRPTKRAKSVAASS